MDIPSAPSALEDIREAQAEVERGEYVTGEEMRHLLEERRHATRRNA